MCYNTVAGMTAGRISGERMEIKVAQNAGFCFGVKKAVDSVYQMLDSGEKIAVLGELIHNQRVINDLRARGVITIEHIDDCPPDAVLVIRTHGVGRDVLELSHKRAKKVMDLTCPYVAKIHNVVARYSADGYDIVIVGDRMHPEVMGIEGWCQNGAHIVYEEEEAERLVLDRVCVVAQTTINKNKFDNLIKIIKNNCKEVVIFDTICKSTKIRQQEAEEIAKTSDVVFVVGGRGSSNTKKLFDICKANCPLTFLIESFEETPQNINYKNKKIGITAGASTPAGSIEEVVKVMQEDIVSQGGQEMSFEEAMERSLKTLNTGDVVSGTVVEVRPTEVIVDLGFKSDGIIPASELSDDSDATPDNIVKPGDEIKAFVVGVNDAEGKTLLSKKKLDSIEAWKRIEEAYENKAIVSGKVSNVVNGGMIVMVEGIRVFIPASLASDRYTEDLSVFLNQTVDLKIIDINQRRRRVTGSVRAVLVEKKKKQAEQFWAEAEVGKWYTGTVKSLASFGAFVDVGGVDGLVHISELSWLRINHPSEVVNVGDSVEVYIKGIDREEKKVSLGYKKAEDNPWVIAQNRFSVGDIVKCKVVRFMPFGAFVELMPGVDGLVHISQIANKHVAKPSDELSIGQEIEAKIMDANWDNKRISLSIRALLPLEKNQAESQEIMAAEEAKSQDKSEVAEPVAAEEPQETALDEAEPSAEGEVAEPVAAEEPQEAAPDEVEPSAEDEAAEPAAVEEPQEATPDEAEPNAEGE